MATIEGAQAVGLGDEVSSLEVGKQADLILVDLTTLNLSPALEVPRSLNELPLTRCIKRWHC